MYNIMFQVHYTLFLKFLFIYLFFAVLGLRFCARAFSSCGKRGPLFIAVRGPLTVTASVVAEQTLQKRRLSSCGSRAWLLRGMWDLPRPGLEPVSPALAGRFSTTAPPGKPYTFNICIHYEMITTMSLVAFLSPNKLWCYWPYSLCCILHHCDLSIVQF